MRQSRRDRVRDITETHVNHHGMSGVKERNRVKEGEKRGKKQGEDGREVERMKANSKLFDEEGDSQASLLRCGHICITLRLKLSVSHLKGRI